MRYLLTLLLLICSTQAAPQAADPKAKTKAPAKAAAAPAASDADIAAAKAKGLVWVNLNTGVYHKDGQFFGKTKNGKFMTEDDAKKAGHHAAKEPGTKHASDQKDKPKAAAKK